MAAPDPQKLQGHRQAWSHTGRDLLQVTCMQVTADLSKEKPMEHLIHAITALLDYLF